MRKDKALVAVLAAVFIVPLPVSDVIAAELCISEKECTVTPQGEEVCKEVRKCIELKIPPFIA